MYQQLTATIAVSEPVPLQQAFRRHVHIVGFEARETGQPARTESGYPDSVGRSPANANSELN